MVPMQKGVKAVLKKIPVGTEKAQPVSASIVGTEKVQSVGPRSFRAKHYAGHSDDVVWRRGAARIHAFFASSGARSSARSGKRGARLAARGCGCSCAGCGVCAASVELVVLARARDSRAPSGAAPDDGRGCFVCGVFRVGKSGAVARCVSARALRQRGNERRDFRGVAGAVGVISARKSRVLRSVASGVLFESLIETLQSGRKSEKRGRYGKGSGKASVKKWLKGNKQDKRLHRQFFTQEGQAQT